MSITVEKSRPDWKRWFSKISNTNLNVYKSLHIVVVSGATPDMDII